MRRVWTVKRWIRGELVKSEGLSLLEALRLLEDLRLGEGKPATLAHEKLGDVVDLEEPWIDGCVYCGLAFPRWKADRGDPVCPSCEGA